MFNKGKNLDNATAAAATMLARQLRNSAFIRESSTRYLSKKVNERVEHYVELH